MNVPSLRAQISWGEVIKRRRQSSGSYFGQREGEEGGRANRPTENPLPAVKGTNTTGKKIRLKALPAGFYLVLDGNTDAKRKKMLRGNREKRIFTWGREMNNKLSALMGEYHQQARARSCSTQAARSKFLKGRILKRVRE